VDVPFLEPRARMGALCVGGQFIYAFRGLEEKKYDDYFIQNPR
jgi:hypothetical protein